jgi:hypothetical protein
MVLESSNMIVLISLSCLQGTPNEQLVVDAHDSRQVQHTLDCGDGPLFFFSMEPQTLLVWEPLALGPYGATTAMYWFPVRPFLCHSVYLGNMTDYV